MCKRRSLFTLLLVLLAAPSWAAYTTATVVAPIEKGAVTLHVVVEFSGNAGEPTVQRDFYVSSLADLQQYQAAEKVRLNGVSAEGIKLSVGQVIADPLPVTTTPSNAQVWFAKLFQAWSVKAAIDAGLVPSTKAYTDLLAEVQATFQESYVTQSGWPLR